MVNLKSGVGIGATLSEALGDIEDSTVIDLQALCHTPAVLNSEVLRVIQAHHAAEVLLLPCWVIPISTGARPMIRSEENKSKMLLLFIPPYYR